MNKTEITEKLRGIILDIDKDVDLARVEASPELPLSDTAGFDSLDYMLFAGDIEDVFDVEIPGDDYHHLKTLDGVMGWLAENTA